MHYDLKKSKTQPDSGHKGYDSCSSKARHDSKFSKEKTSSSESNKIKILQNHEIRCVYKINMTNYYRNVPIYNYKKRIVI